MKIRILTSAIDDLSRGYFFMKNRVRALEITSLTLFSPT